jgi:glutaredoxin 3
VSRPEIVMYASGWCPYCQRARQLFERKKLAFSEIDVEDAAAIRQTMIKRAGRTSVPQIFIGERHVGGFDELSALDRSGELDRLLEEK